MTWVFCVLYLSFEIYLDIKFTLRTCSNFFFFWKYNHSQKLNLKEWMLFTLKNINIIHFRISKNFKIDIFLRNIFHLLSSKKLPCVKAYKLGQIGSAASTVYWITNRHPNQIYLICYNANIMHCMPGNIIKFITGEYRGYSEDKMSLIRDSVHITRFQFILLRPRVLEKPAPTLHWVLELNQFRHTIEYWS